MKFGDRVVNPWATERNPHKVGYFVRWIRRTGKCNPGTFMELTDKKGNFWQLPKDTNKMYAKQFGQEALEKELAYDA